MKIMISGGYDEAAEFENEQIELKQFAEATAVQIIKQGHELRCANLSSLDDLVIEAACNAAIVKGYDPEQVVVSYVPPELPPRNPRGQVNDSANNNWASMDGRNLKVPEPVAQADVVILIGGFSDKSGTYTAANWARHTGTPILPVSTFGMAAKYIYDDLPNGVEGRKITGLASEDIQKLARNRGMLTDEDAIEEYAHRIVSLSEKAGLSRTVFVIMSFEKDDYFKDYLAAVTEVCGKAGFDAVRTDTRPVSDTALIIDAIHENIETCGFVIADLTNMRPNVYYEIGYAMGLEKRLILTNRKGGEVHFDLQGYNRMEWSGTENLKEQLRPVVNEIAVSFGLSPG